jgi:hypothetical protein
MNAAETRNKTFRGKANVPITNLQFGEFEEGTAASREGLLVAGGPPCGIFG